MGGVLANLVLEGSCIHAFDRSLEKFVKLGCLCVHAVALDYTLVRGLSHTDNGVGRHLKTGLHHIRQYFNVAGGH
jgi:hypothetical protein